MVVYLPAVTLQYNSESELKMVKEKTKKSKKIEDVDSDSDNDFDELISDCVKEVVVCDQLSNFTSLHSSLTKAGSVKEVKLKNDITHACKGGMCEPLLMPLYHLMSCELIDTHLLYIHSEQN